MSTFDTPGAASTRSTREEELNQGVQNATRIAVDRKRELLQELEKEREQTERLILHEFSDIVDFQEEEDLHGFLRKIRNELIDSKRKIRLLDEQLDQNNKYIRQVQAERIKEAQVIREWQKDILLNLRQQQLLEREPEHFNQQLPPSYHRKYVNEDTDLRNREWEEEDFTRIPRRRSIKEKQYQSTENDALLEVLLQGEKIYEKIMETSTYLRAKLTLE